jgi:aerobic-type carbon monoxide dehydrogenase small subunit (CoxS/CutS family)
MSVKFLVNGSPAEFDGPRMSRCWVVREHLVPLEAKARLRIGACGAARCISTALPSDLRDAGHVAGGNTSRPSRARPDADHPVQKARVELDVPHAAIANPA